MIVLEYVRGIYLICMTLSRRQLGRHPIGTLRPQGDTRALHEPLLIRRFRGADFNFPLSALTPPDYLARPRPLSVHGFQCHRSASPNRVNPESRPRYPGFQRGL